MKKVIALWGSGDSGKTSTLKIVHSELLKLSDSFLEEFRETGDDIRDVLMINGIKIGIESQGDPGSRLEESLKIFKENGCELIICATRSRGSTVVLVDNLKPLYHISWRGQSQLTDETLREESNNAIASLILNEVKDFIYA